MKKPGIMPRVTAMILTIMLSASSFGCANNDLKDSPESIDEVTVNEPEETTESPATTEAETEPETTAEEEEVILSDFEFLSLGGGEMPAKTGGLFLYKRVGDIELKFYLTQPTKKVYEKAPLLINFIGPGWTRTEVTTQICYLGYHFGQLLGEGFANLTISYRGSNNGGTMSENLADLMDALSYLYRYQDHFGIDMDRIILLGQSAGAHVALMLQLAPEELLTADCVYPKSKQTFLGTVTINAPTMLYPDEETGKLLGSAVPATSGLFNGINPFTDDTQQRKYSPITYVSADMKPVFMGAGTADSVIEMKQSELFEAAAKNVGGDCTLFVLENAGHSLEAIGGEVTPPAKDFHEEAYQFVLGLIK